MDVRCIISSISSSYSHTQRVHLYRRALSQAFLILLMSTDGRLPLMSLLITNPFPSPTVVPIVPCPLLTHPASPSKSPFRIFLSTAKQPHRHFHNNRPTNIQHRPASPSHFPYLRPLFAKIDQVHGNGFLHCNPPTCGLTSPGVGEITPTEMRPSRSFAMSTGAPAVSST
ncbi:hypothetical protein PSPO01_01535 [Paraphaeosphaeria sporulosa]